MTEEVLMIGEVKVFDHPVVMKCYGLGTCVGLFIKDRSTGITGGAHIFLPTSTHGKTFDGGVAASECVEVMLDRMKALGASIHTLRAKIAGGANPLMQFHEVGKQNIEEVINALIRNQVYIAAMDVGGNISRSVRFNASSGQMMVKQLEWNSTKIF